MEKEQTKTSARHRHRATAACGGCRKARIRCVRDPGTTTCVNCRVTEQTCVYDAKDGRKSRASAKAVEATLMQRIHELEAQLKEANEAKQTRADAFQQPNEQPPPYTSPEQGSLSLAPVDDVPVAETPDPDQANSVVTKLMPSAIRFDMASGRVRYFGSTTHMNVLSRVGTRPKEPRTQNIHWPIALIERDMLPETHDYLMELFWSKHNSVIHLVHLDVFHRDQQQGGLEYYSTFLHLTMLATGFRYADKTREDIKRLSRANYVSSSLHEKAKQMAKLEMDKPGGIPSIQAFQLLGGLEFCCGNDETGWLFTGMCFRMVFDAGLHVDPSSLCLPEREMQIRHMVLWACMATDRLWALYLGRPTTIKTSDIAPSCLSFDFSMMLMCRPSWHEKKSTTKIYEALLRMMEHVSQLCDLRGPRPSKSTELYLKLAAIDQQLRDWYNSLPKRLKWSKESHETMPPSYYLLHTQYNAALILLHRGFVRYDERSEESDSHFKNLSRTSCAESAKLIAEIFEQYRTRFKLEIVYGTAVQHVGTAATALMGEAVLQTDSEQRILCLEKLSSLRLSLSLMSRNYQPAGQMTNVVDQFIRSVQDNSSRQSSQSSSRHPNSDEAGESSSAGSLERMTGQEALGSGMPSDLEGLFASDRQWKRTRLDTPYEITPNCAGAQSPSGLPFLPSSFLEGLNANDFMFAELAGMGECNFPWDDQT